MKLLACREAVPALTGPKLTKDGTILLTSSASCRVDHRRISQSTHRAVEANDDCQQMGNGTVGGVELGAAVMLIQHVVVLL